MRRAFPVVLLVLGASCATKTSVPFEPGTDRHHFDIVLEESGAGTYSCAVRVTDLVAKKTISARPVTAHAGAPGEGYEDDAASGARLDVSLSVDSSARLATCAASVRKDGRLVASDRATLEVR